MAKLDRAIMKVFGETAEANEIEKIGSLRDGNPVFTKDPVLLQELARYSGGLVDVVTSEATYIPALEDINALYFLITRQLAYLFQDGIPDWDDDTTYYENSIAKKPGTGDLYISKTDDNQGNELSDTDHWGVHFEPGGIVPLGTIIPFYDFNGALSFDTDRWAYCNGQSKTITGIGAQTLPDLSGRYLVGFGTDGGANIHSAAWSADPVGNAGHTINIEHTHTGPSHTHTGPSHTHAFTSSSISTNTTGVGSSHSHGVGSLQFKSFRVAGTAPGPDIYAWYANGTEIQITEHGGLTLGSNQTWSYIRPTDDVWPRNFYTKDGSGSTAPESAHTHSMQNHTHSGTTGASGTGATGASGTGATGSTLSSAQTIQPRSVRVRYLCRIA